MSLRNLLRARVSAILTAVLALAPGASHTLAQRADEPLVLTPIATLGPGANKEVSGIVKSRTHPGVFWTLNDSGDEPRVFPVRIDGSVISSVRDEKSPGVRIAGATNSDWEDIALDDSGRLVIADFGNNSNARRDLTLYLVPEPEPTAEHTGILSRIVFRYPDQRAFPAPSDDKNFDAEGVFTVGDEIYVLSKNRSGPYTKLYRVDDRTPDAVTTLTYLGRFDIGGRATGADASPDGLRLAILTYTHLWLFERPERSMPFFAGRVRARAYTYADGKSDSESITFEDDEHLLIADETRASLSRVRLADLPVVREGAPRPAGNPEHDVRVMSFNIRYAGGDRGANAWERRASACEQIVRAFDPDILGVQEAVALQADWLRTTFPAHAFHGVGREDGRRAGEFVPILYRADRFTRLASGHFWLSDTPDVPGSRGWDGACERMASWVRLRDRLSERTLLVVNTHLDHVGQVARREGMRLIRARLRDLAQDAAVVVLGDFNTSADGPEAAPLLLAPPDDVPLLDTYRALFREQDTHEATFSAWDARIWGERIDWILASPTLGVVDATIERRMPAGRTPSDHWPVAAVLRWTPGATAPRP
jgi:endonuclease/exonuclease/phosphatase family metal-dependent hydrolase